MLSFAIGSSFAANPESTDEASDLLKLQSVLDNANANQLEPLSKSGSCSVKLISLALLYRIEPDKYRNDFFSSIVVDDYADRKNGKYNYVDPEQIEQTIGTATAAPTGVTDQRIKSVIGFCAIKDKNLWVTTKKAGRISLARFLRGAAVSSLLTGTDEDVLEITNAIDAHTAESHDLH